MPTLKSALGIALLVAANTVGAEFYTGDQLKQELEKKTGSLALGYVAAVADVYSRVSICPPESATVGLAADVVYKYLQEHPKSLHVGADALAYTALMTAWPCSKSESRPSKSPPPKTKPKAKPKPKPKTPLPS